MNTTVTTSIFRKRLFIVRIHDQHGALLIVVVVIAAHVRLNVLVFFIFVSLAAFVHLRIIFSI
jgi:hypothetical protein